MKIINGQSFSYIYKKLLDTLLFEYDYENNARNKKTKECLDVILTIDDPLLNLFSCTERPFPNYYLAGELIWYFTGRRDVDFISKFSKFWLKLADNNNNLNSAYGYLLFDKSISKLKFFNQWMWAYNSLVKDKDSRQSILRFNNDDHQYEGNKDFVCTLLSQFFIRNNTLFMTTHMRSSDIIRGLTFDFPFFSLLHQQMRLHLLPIYPDLKLGYNRMILGSSHLYSEHYDLAEKMLESGIFENHLPPIELNLINEKGLSSKEIIEIEKVVEWNKKLTTQLTDPLHSWIYNNSFKSKE